MKVSEIKRTKTNYEVNENMETIFQKCTKTSNTKEIAQYLLS